MEDDDPIKDGSVIDRLLDSVCGENGGSAGFCRGHADRFAR